MSLIEIFKEVFTKKKYLFSAIIISIIFYSLNIVISSWKILKDFSSDKSFFGTIKIFFSLFFGFGTLTDTYSFISIILISILFGILFSLILYKTEMNITLTKRTGILGGVGVFLAVLVPGCSACGVGLISVLGIGAGVLSFLPFRGLEISILSIIILSFAIAKITKDMYVCKISNSFKKMENRKLKGGNKNE